MATNREACEKYILDSIEKICPGGENREIYARMFEKMTNEQFDRFIADIETGQRFLVITAPNFGQSKLSVKRNLALAKEFGHEFFQRIWIGQNGDTPMYLSPIKYLVMDLPLRRASQLLIKKLSVPEHNKTIDALSGQPTGDSTGARVSFPELQVIAAMGLDNCATELIKYRGGDVKGHNAMNAMISRYGEANLDTLKNYASGVESTRNLKTFLTSMHLSNSLV